MAINVADFRTAFPEFTNTPEPLVTDRLSRASKEHDSGSWGELWETAVFLKTAHYLAITPQGREMRLSSEKSSETSYSKRLEELTPLAGFGALCV